MRYSGKVELCPGAENPGAEHPSLPAGALADLDLGLFSGAGAAHLFALCARISAGAISLWLAAVLIGTGIAGLRGQLPGAEPRPYILRFDEDKPNPALPPGLLHLRLERRAELRAAQPRRRWLIAAATGVWYMKQIYHYAYMPLCAFILLLGILGKLPRVESSTKSEGTERRYFYGSVWAVTAAQTLLLVLWKVLPLTRASSVEKLAAYVGVLLLMGWFAYRGWLPRTRPIVAGEWMVSD